jgi:hypothetical protein
MTHHITTRFTTHKFLSIAAAALFTAASTVACSGSSLESAPFAPSAMPSSTLSAEADESSAVFETLGKEKDKDKPKTESGSGSDSGKGKGKGTQETATTSTVVEAEGAIVTATGECPAKTFTIGTESFTTDAATTYKGGACTGLVALAQVEVRATTGTDGTLTVTRVEFEAADADDDAEGEEVDDDDAEEGHGNPHLGTGPFSGTVSMFRGTCPLVSFNLKGMRISTTETTTYEGAAEGEDACSLLRPNVQVTVTGTAGETRNSFIAETITIDRTH